MRANTPENARLTFDHVVTDRLQEMIDTNFEFYKRVTDDPEFGKFFVGVAVRAIPPVGPGRGGDGPGESRRLALDSMLRRAQSALAAGFVSSSANGK